MANREADEGDMFDAVLDMESEFIQTGTAEGCLVGQKRGYLEGKQMGIQKGSELGTEIGFYCGCVRTWIHLCEEYPQKFTNGRIRARLTKLKELIDHFPMSDPHTSVRNSTFLYIITTVQTWNFCIFLISVLHVPRGTSQDLLQL